jgi:hypothetical protein|uniref:Uncharacterized protein n=1 Tax=Picea glauca TaxID=3330 RepID=A0A101LYG0_PICGL|nr:hypothetical protein ABT39_MTgene5839 [Picea glauca]
MYLDFHLEMKLPPFTFAPFALAPISVLATGASGALFPSLTGRDATGYESIGS